MPSATGTFEVELVPQPKDGYADGTTLGRLTIDNVATLTLTVVPDSGTGELTGLSGSMAILVADGKHSYEMNYALPGAP